MSNLDDVNVDEQHSSTENLANLQRYVKPMSQIDPRKRSEVWNFFGHMMLGENPEEPGTKKSVYCIQCFEKDKNSNNK